MSLTAINDGAVGVGGALVQLFAGNPAQGGTLLAERVIDTPIGPLSSLPLDIEIAGFPRNRQITIYGVIDPLNAIAECNEGDNTDPADTRYSARTYADAAASGSGLGAVRPGTIVS